MRIRRDIHFPAATEPRHIARMIGMIEQLIAQADARGESAGMVTNMVRRAMGLSAGGQHRSSGVTTDAITKKIGELRDKTRRTRGAGDEGQ